ncbi:MAG: hypothetical protein IJX77_09770 [Ruminococcus sp.]|nr:hypothetical protein [Ruminococcus sp.]
MMKLKSLRSFVLKLSQNAISVVKGSTLELDDNVAKELIKIGYAVECTEEQNTFETEQEMNPDTEITSSRQETPETEQETPEPAKKKKSKAKKAEVKPDETESGFAK